MLHHTDAEVFRDGLSAICECLPVSEIDTGVRSCDDYARTLAKNSLNRRQYDECRRTIDGERRNSLCARQSDLFDGEHLPVLDLADRRPATAVRVQRCRDQDLMACSRKTARQDGQRRSADPIIVGYQDTQSRTSRVRKPFSALE